MKKKAGVILGLALFLTAGLCRADAKIETEKILKETINQGIEILKNKETNDDQKLKAFDILLQGSCHTGLMSMLVLGKKGWGAFNSGQRNEFTASFVKLLTRTYYSKLKQADVTDVEIEYKENIEVSKSKRLIKTVMGESGEGFEVDYKFGLRKGRWAFYDMEVEGISLIASYRSQFTDFLKTKSPAELLKEMKSNQQKFTAKAVVK